jgi:adenosylcobinamide kinase/adenosylcobinamide-phosphate guanylyltransferase
VAVVKQLILGGARSGKSRLAEKLAVQSGLEVTYIATATANDKEMQRRIEQHRDRRPSHWGLVEEPFALAQVLGLHAGHGRLLLVDCLTLWLSNLICREQPVELRRELDALLEILPDLPGEIILVSNEVGMGIVPMGELCRQFQDEMGLLQQRIAERCERVVVTLAGLPLVLKPAGTYLSMED